MEPTTEPSARLNVQQWRQIIKQQHEGGLSQKRFVNPATLAFQYLETQTGEKRRQPHGPVATSGELLLD